MAKQNKNEDDELDEDQINEDELLDEEDEDEEDTKPEGGKEKKKSEPAKDGEEEAIIVQEDGEEVGAEDSAKAAEDEAALEEKRARRRREKKMRRERDKRERFNMQNELVQLRDTVKALSDGAPQFIERLNHIEKNTTSSEMAELGRIYNSAQAQMKEAIKAGDGDAFVKAKEISDKAWHRYATLEVQQKMRPGTAQAPGSQQEHHQPQRRQTEQESEDNQTTFSPRVTQLATKWAANNSDWYARGGNRESKLVEALDLELIEDGYDPESQEYWDELTDRAKEILPHRFKRPTTKQNPVTRPKQIVGGSSGNGAPVGGGIELPAEFRATLKAAGYERGSPEWKKAVNNYITNQKLKKA